MWIHIVIFMVILGAFLAGKLGRLPPWAGNAEGQKLFILVALAGNIIGMLLTVQSGGGTVFHPDTVWKKRRQVLTKRNS